jgi:hypothetical protein
MTGCAGCKPTQAGQAGKKKSNQRAERLTFYGRFFSKKTPVKALKKLKVQKNYIFGFKNLFLYCKKSYLRRRF